MRPRIILALAALAGLAGGCGQDNPRLIPAADAQALVDTVDQIETACADGDVGAAREALDQAAAEVNGLPRRVDDGLEDNLRAWLRRIENRLERDCAAEETPTPTPTPAETPTPTPAETPTPTPEATETPPPDVTPDPTVIPDPGDGDGGGVPAPGEEGDG